MYTGPKLINDELVFGYDAGYGVANNNTPTRFYPGEPTVNLMTSHFESLGTDGSGQSSVGTRTAIATNHVRIVDNGSNTRQHVYVSSLTAGTTYTLSNQFKKISGTPTWRYQIQAYNNSSYVSTIKFTNTAEIGLLDIDGWQTAKWTFTLPANSNKVLIFFQDGADYTTYDHSFEVKNPQLEAKGHATPYVSGTRSNTQSLIDLKRTTDTTVAYMSFDSTGQPEFDGTDDYVDLGSDITISPINQGWTAEYVFNSDSASTLQHFNSAEADSENSNWLALFQSYLQVWDHGQNVARSALITRYIGRYEYNNSYGRYFNGHIPIARLYDAPLTAAQIKQNYKAYKNRFNI